MPTVQMEALEHQDTLHHHPLQVGALLEPPRLQDLRRRLSPIQFHQFRISDISPYHLGWNEYRVL
jgi:hypothetical protein